jgi:hypothetical protein
MILLISAYQVARTTGVSHSLHLASEWNILRVTANICDSRDLGLMGFGQRDVFENCSLLIHLYSHQWHRQNGPGYLIAVVAEMFIAELCTKN